MVDGITPEAGISIVETDAEPPVLYASSTDGRSSSDVLTLDRPAIDGQYDSTVNVTSLAVFADCPRKYYLQRYIGWNGRRPSRFDPEDLPEDDVADENAAELGSAVHEILAGKSGTYSAEAQRLANVFLSSELGARAAAATPSAREWDFIVDVEGTLVRGMVDLWFEENGEIIVVDYKTDKAIHAEAYMPQLALYGLAIERAFGKRPSHAWLHFLRPNTLVEVPLDYSVEDLLAKLRAAQDTLRFDLNEGDHCRSCQFHRNLCPAGLSVSQELPDGQTLSQSAADA
jgi:CRISPR/Cas system-associated exonuclease Cas4 (RecB family)